MVGSRPGGSRDEYCFPDIEGTPGHNGWWVPPIHVSYVHSANVTEIETWLNGSWVPYSGPFNITKKGDLSSPFRWRYRTIENGDEWIYGSAQWTFKIDWDKPSVSIIIERRGFLLWKKCVITANASDSMSGVDCVEFYLNGLLQSTDHFAPYQWILCPVPRGHTLTVDVRAYDMAGNFNDSEKTGSCAYSNAFPENPQFNHPFLFLWTLWRDLRDRIMDGR